MCTHFQTFRRRCVGLRCVCVCVCVCATHPKIHRATYIISPGSHECGESGRAIGRVQALSHVAIKVQVYDWRDAAFSARQGLVGVFHQGMYSTNTQLAVHIRPP